MKHLNKYLAMLALLCAVMWGTTVVSAGTLIVATGSFGAAANSIYSVDTVSGNATALYSGFSVWGMTADSTNRVWFTANDGGLYNFALGDAAPTFVGTTSPMAPNTNDRLDGLAFSNGVLYGWQQFDDAVTFSSAGLYSVNTGDASRTLVAANSGLTGAISGIDADPATGQIYGSNDTSGAFETVALNATTSFFASYPAGEFDIDGLAAGGGSLWAVLDDAAPTNIYEISIATGNVVGTLPSPFTATDTFSAGAFIPEPTAGLLLLLGFCGLGALRRR